MHLVPHSRSSMDPCPGHRDRPDRVLRDRRADGTAGL